MTGSKPTSTPSPRPRTLQDDLLADLRQATPMPVAPPRSDRAASVPAAPSQPPQRVTPSIEVRVTPLRWSLPSLRSRADGPGLVLTAGPVRVTATGFGR